MIENVILVVILVIIVGSAGLYIYNSKKKGKNVLVVRMPNSAEAINATATAVSSV